MAIPSWPAELPERPSREGFSYSFGDGRLMTEMDAGPPKIRLRFSATVEQTTASFIGDQDDIACLKRFWREGTKGGVLPFTTIDPLLHELPIATASRETLTDQDGQPLLVSAYDLVLFGKTPPQISALGGSVFRASYSITILP